MGPQVRHMMRSFTSPADSPLLFASTYEAGEALRKQVRRLTAVM